MVEICSWFVQAHISLLSVFTDYDWDWPDFERKFKAASPQLLACLSRLPLRPVPHGLAFSLSRSEFSTEAVSLIQRLSM
jgi:hypothetical protein